MGAKIIRAIEYDPNDPTHQQWYVAGGVDAPGVARWITTLASDAAATHATNILTKLREK